MVLMRGKKNLRRPRLYGRTGTYNLHPELNLWLSYFTDQADCHSWPVGSWERNGVEVQGHSAQGPVRNRATLETKSGKQKLSVCLLSVKSPSGGLESALHEDCLSYQVKLPPLHTPGLPVQPLLFISCCELDCGHHRLWGPAGPGVPMSLLAVVWRVNRHLQEVTEPSTQLGWLCRICLLLLNMPTPKTPIYETVIWHPFIITGREADNFLACMSSGLLWTSAWGCDKLHPRGAISLHGR